jgi:uncharacterized coiled-coil protein SlyX
MPPPAALPEDPLQRIERLERRVEALERRIAELEKALAEANNDRK